MYVNEKIIILPRRTLLKNNLKTENSGRPENFF